VSTPASPRPESRPAAHDFDLDVRLAPVARRVASDEGQRATEITCTQCTTNEFTCKC
jgi:hypothetical protein